MTGLSGAAPAWAYSTLLKVTLGVIEAASLIINPKNIPSKHCTVDIFCSTWQALAMLSLDPGRLYTTLRIVTSNDHGHKDDDLGLTMIER